MRSQKYYKERLAGLKITVHQGLVPRVFCECGFEFERVDQGTFSSVGHNMPYDKEYGKRDNKAYDPYNPNLCSEIIAQVSVDYGAPQYSIASRRWFWYGMKP